MRWAKVRLDRDQIVLFPERLDDALPSEHPVRLLDDVLRQVDWSSWEAQYKDVPRGQPPIHPRVLASVLLYGLLVRIRASRKLEAALWERLDFKWLAEDLKIDHTTLCEFRRKHTEPLLELFVQIGLIAQQAMLAPLKRLTFDGTRIKANNNRHRCLTPERLQEIKAGLTEKFAEFEQLANVEDLAAAGDEELPEELRDLQRRARRIEGALQEIERLNQADEKVPNRIPLTDPQSRVLKNKEGGFAANYTPMVGVDADSGLIVTGDVVAQTTEEQHLVEAVADVLEQFGTRPAEVLVDGLFATGENLAALDALDVTVYSPGKQPVADAKTNPAIRADLTQPVPAELHDRLPTRNVKGTDGKQLGKQLDKQAFVYDSDSDCYRCPQGKRLDKKQTTTDHRRQGTVIHRSRYQADEADCAECPLKNLCLGGAAKSRSVSRDQFEEHREELTERMQTEEAKTIYGKRAPVGERPFAVIKQDFGVRQFLLRGLDRVRNEWRWLLIAFNLKKLIHHLQSRAGPTMC